jgi:hypothetical protein
MTDLSPLVRKPPLRQAVGGYVVEVRKLVFGIFGILLTSPITALGFAFGAANLGLVSLILGAGFGLLLSVTRPQGQTMVGYLWGAVTGRNGRLHVGDEWVRVCVGLAPIAAVHDGTPVDVFASAVPVSPDHVDARGYLHVRDVTAAGIRPR